MSATPTEEPVIDVAVHELKLGRNRAHGLHWPGVIHVDSRLRGRQQLEIFTHEFLHEICPEWDEGHVTTQAKKIAAFLWSQGFRRDKRFNKDATK